MSRHLMFGVGGVILGIILLIILSSIPWLGFGIIALAIAVPIIAWRALDSSQRRRIRAMRSRRQLGR